MPYRYANQSRSQALQEPQQNIPSYDDIIADYGVDAERLHIVHVGVDPQQFRPMEDVNVVPGRLMTTASATWQ